MSSSERPPGSPAGTAALSSALEPIAQLRVSPIGDAAPTPVNEYFLTAGQSFRIGRSANNDLVLAESKVSRFHALFSASRTGVVISDLSSTNGTFVNGNRMNAPVDLADRDEVQIGNYQFIVTLTQNQDQGTSESARTVLSNMQPFEVSVLLVDVCGYTSMTQVHPEADVMDTLRNWLNFAAGVITKHQGTVDKFIGDCVMALWRSDSASPQSLAQNAARAGTEIVEATLTQETFANWKHSSASPWQCRAVIHSGTALLGSVGGGKGSYTVLGDTVNIAFRLEHLADRFSEKLIVSGQTAELLAGEQTLHSLGFFTLEGRSGSMEVFGRHVTPSRG